MPNRARPIETPALGWLRRGTFVLLLTSVSLLAGCEASETDGPTTPTQTPSDTSTSTAASASASA